MLDVQTSDIGNEENYMNMHTKKLQNSIQDEV